jgi:4-hydroxy-3-methylbut-2-en-1-yl diphosphate synthase IspG/GcpE
VQIKTQWRENLEGIICSTFGYISALLAAKIALAKLSLKAWNCQKKAAANRTRRAKSEIPLTTTKFKIYMKKYV